MKDWINNNIDGGSLASFITVMVILYGVGVMLSKDQQLDRYRTENNLVYIKGWVKPSTLNSIQFEEVE